MTDNKDEKMPTWFKDHELVQKYENEQKQKTIKEREKLASQLAEVQAKEAEGFPESEARVQELEEKIKELEQNLMDNQSEFAKVKSILYGNKLSLELKAGNLRRELLKNYDPIIDEAISYFREKFEEFRRKSIGRQVVDVKKNIFTEKKSKKYISNYPALVEGLKYCQNAIKNLEGFKLLPTIDSAVIQKMKDEIPDTEEMTEFESIEALEGSKGPDPLAWIKSDSQQEWELKKLNEKYETIMKR